MLAYDGGHFRSDGCEKWQGLSQLSYKTLDLVWIVDHGEHREIIDLVYYHEKSVEEAAEIVGIPENTVKTRIYARKRLAELLKSEGIERGWP